MGKLANLKNLKPTPPTPTHKEVDLDLVEDNFVQVNGRSIVLLGPPKVGKTYAAATLSQYFPKEFPVKDQVELKDMLWILADKGGTDTLKALNLKVDQIPMYKFYGQSEGQFSKPQDLMAEVAKIAKQKIADEGKTCLVIDTVSVLDDMISHYYEQVCTPKTTNGGRDSFAIHRLMTNDHFQIWKDLIALPCDVIFLFHTKIAGEAALKKAKAEALPPGGTITNIIIDTSFQDTAKIYRSHNSLIASIQIDKGERVLYTKSKNGMEGGSRYENILDEKEPPHLGQLFDKIDSNIGQSGN